MRYYILQNKNVVKELYHIHFLFLFIRKHLIRTKDTILIEYFASHKSSKETDLTFDILVLQTEFVKNTEQDFTFP